MPEGSEVRSGRANREAPLRPRVNNLSITSYLEADLVMVPVVLVEVFFLRTGCFFVGFLAGTSDSSLG